MKQGDDGSSIYHLLRSYFHANFALLATEMIGNSRLMEGMKHTGNKAQEAQGDVDLYDDGWMH